ncbi:MAG: ATP-binding protein [Actinobacteria bacterium]|nr:MAG: ATP-binding protein [Actinomycetota bacterium]
MNINAPEAFENPFRPGAGHRPPYLAGRLAEQREFEKLLAQDIILENPLLTGLRGVGKTVLLETFKPLALQHGWIWVGTDLSESASVSEEALAIRLMADLSVATSTLVIGEAEAAGFVGEKNDLHLDFGALTQIFQATPGLIEDKLKAVLEVAAQAIARDGGRGVVFAYDEAQNLADSEKQNEFPLSLLLDVFQSIQRKGIPFMLALTGLPTLFPKLVEARTFAERMFRVIVLDKLDDEASSEAILKPIEDAHCPVKFTPESVGMIIEQAGGYPYFIQFICREVFDSFVLLQRQKAPWPYTVPLDAITMKLDSDFFAGRWGRATDRQRDLLWAIATLGKPDQEFTVQEVVQASKKLEKPFTSSHVNQMLVSLCSAGLVYKNRFGKYSFAVPLFDRFILRQVRPPV